MNNSKFSFSTPKLTSVTYNDNPDFNEGTNITINIDSKTDIKRADKEPVAYVSLTVSLDKENNLPFCFDVTMGTEINWDLDIDEECIDSILKNNVPALLLSYIRPLITVLTSNCDFPALRIPFVDFRDNKS